MRSPASKASEVRFQWMAPEVQRATRVVFPAIRPAAPRVAKKVVIETMLPNRRLNLAVSPRTNISVRAGAEFSIILPVNC